MLALLLVLCASAGEPLDAASLAAMGPAARVAALTEALARSGGHPEDSARFSTALGVCEISDGDLVDGVEPYLRAALSHDPVARRKALETARSGEPAPAGGAGLASLNAYRDGRLTRFGYSQLHLQDNDRYWTTAAVSHKWAVSDGAGHALSAHDFAFAVGDEDTATTLVRSRRAWIWGGAGMAVAGAGIMGATLAYREANPATWRTDMSTLGMVLGAAVLTTGLGGVALTSNRNQKVHGWYRPEEVDQWIAAHNGELRQQLGLTVEEVREIELAAGMRFQDNSPDPALIIAEIESRSR